MAGLSLSNRMPRSVLRRSLASQQQRWSDCLQETCRAGLEAILPNPVRSELVYSASLNLITKVLDFIQLGGPDLTVDSTIFEMWLGL